MPIYQTYTAPTEYALRLLCTCMYGLALKFPVRILGGGEYNVKWKVYVMLNLLWIEYNLLV